MTERHYYAGFSEVELPVDTYNFGLGVSLRKTYAHFMALIWWRLRALNQANPIPRHGAPQKGVSYDITVELAIPTDTSLPGGLSAKDTVWWIAALLRIAGYPYLAVPVLSNQPFSEASTRQDEPDLRPFEIVRRILRAGGEEIGRLESKELDWVKKKWQAGAEMLQRHPAFFSAIRAFDFCTIEGKRSPSLLSVWTGLEQLFSPSSESFAFAYPRTLLRTLSLLVKDDLPYLRKC
jgi:hypothetical protein